MKSGREIELRQQTYFAKQESTGLEALLGQALRLEDEPTLVRAVKAVKRSMARDEGLRRGYVSLAVSGIINAILVMSWIYGWISGGVILGFMILGMKEILDSRTGAGDKGGIRTWRSIAMGSLSILFSTMLLLPSTGLQVPYHPLLLNIYSPPIQTLVLRLGAFLLVALLARDISRVVRLKMERWEAARREEERRRRKLKGIFYTPVKISSETGGRRR